LKKERTDFSKTVCCGGDEEVVREAMARALKKGVVVVVEDVQMAGWGLQREVKVLGEYRVWQGQRVDDGVGVIVSGKCRGKCQIRPSLIIHLP
jgi:uncharacterized protein YaiI (UPF0178 family)